MALASLLTVLQTIGKRTPSLAITHKFRGARALAKKINPTRMPIESKESYCWLENIRQTAELMPDATRCVHIGDRHSVARHRSEAAQGASTCSVGAHDGFVS